MHEDVQPVCRSGRLTLDRAGRERRWRSSGSCADRCSRTSAPTRRRRRVTSARTVAPGSPVPYRASARSHTDSPRGCSANNATISLWRRFSPTDPPPAAHDCPVPPGQCHRHARRPRPCLPGPPHDVPAVQWLDLDHCPVRQRPPVRPQDHGDARAQPHRRLCLHDPARTASTSMSEDAVDRTRDILRGRPSTPPATLDIVICQ